MPPACGEQQQARRLFIGPNQNNNDPHRLSENSSSGGGSSHLPPIITAADAAFTALGWAIRAGDVAAVRDLLEGDEVNYQLLKRADYAGNTAVHLAAVAGVQVDDDDDDDETPGPHPQIVVQQQQQQQQDERRGHTHTHTHTGRDHAAVLRELLVRGASVHARNRANNTPLYLARRAGGAECVALLEAAGAVLWEGEAGEAAATAAG